MFYKIEDSSYADTRSSPEAENILGKGTTKINREENSLGLPGCARVELWRRRKGKRVAGRLPGTLPTIKCLGVVLRNCAIG